MKNIFDIWTPSGMEVRFNDNNTMSFHKRGSLHVLFEISTTKTFETAMQNHYGKPVKLHEISEENDKPCKLAEAQVFQYGL